MVQFASTTVCVYIYIYFFSQKKAAMHFTRNVARVLPPLNHQVYSVQGYSWIVSHCHVLEGMVVSVPRLRFFCFFTCVWMCNALCVDVASLQRDFKTAKPPRFKRLCDILRKNFQDRLGGLHWHRILDLDSFVDLRICPSELVLVVRIQCPKWSKFQRANDVF